MVRRKTRFSLYCVLKGNHDDTPQRIRGMQTPFNVPYLSTVLNQVGQSRILLLCPAVPPNTPLVPNLFIVAASFCLEQQLMHTRQQDMRAFLMPCLHEQWRFTIFYMATQAGKCVTLLHAMNELDHTHNTREESSAWLPLLMCTYICPDFGQKFP